MFYILHFLLLHYKEFHIPAALTEKSFDQILCLELNFSQSAFRRLSLILRKQLTGCHWSWNTLHSLIKISEKWSNECECCSVSAGCVNMYIVTTDNVTILCFQPPKWPKNQYFIIVIVVIISTVIFSHQLHLFFMLPTFLGGSPWTTKGLCCLQLHI